MSHHGPTEFDGQSADGMRKLLDKLQETRRAHLQANVGATGLFPDGKLTPSDEGEITFAVGAENGKVVLNFGKPVAWIGFTPEQAQKLGMLLIRKAAAVRGHPVTIRIGRDAI